MGPTLWIIENKHFTRSIQTPVGKNFIMHIICVTSKHNHIDRMRPIIQRKLHHTHQFFYIKRKRFQFSAFNFKVIWQFYLFMEGIVIFKKKIVFITSCNFYARLKPTNPAELLSSLSLMRFLFLAI